MGVLDLLGVGKRTSSLLTSALSLGIVSPWSGGDLTPVVLADILGTDIVDQMPLTRAEAIGIPAVSKARNLLVSTIAKFPLVAYRGPDVIEPAKQPAFLYRTESRVTPYERMAWTVDDLIFYGFSLWVVKRGAKPVDAAHAPIIQAEYVPMATWNIIDGGIAIDNQPADPEEVILFNSPFEGLLNIANRTMRGARDQEAAWTGRARNPIPMIELHQTDDQLTPEEVTAYVTAWSKARRAENGAIGATPPGLEIRTHGEVKADMYTEGRNAVRTDIGSFTNIRASMLDGTMGIDSLTYSTTQGERNSFYEFDLPFWTDPITARLSMDDVVPHGQAVRFDMYSDPNLPTAPPKED